MNEQYNLYPSGLTRFQLNQLSEYTHQAMFLTPAILLDKASSHLQQAVDAHQKKRLVNLRLATAIQDKIKKVLVDWDKLPEVARPWLAAAILYFSSNHDEEPDFASSIGFEDDLEVLNACLRFAQREDLCLNPEDYDDV